MRRTRMVAGVGVVVLVALVALAAGSFQGHQEPGARVLSPSLTSLPSTSAAPREFPSLAGVPLTQSTDLRLLVGKGPRPFVVDLDRATVQMVTGLAADGERVVSVLPVGEHAVIVSERLCSSCRTPAGEVYGHWRGSTSAVRLGTAQELVAARGGRAVWLLSHQTVNACTLREVGLDGRLRRPSRPVSCASKLLGELPAGLLVASGPSEEPWDRPTSLVDHRGRRTRLGFPAANLLAATGQLLLTSAEPRAPLTLTDLRSHRSWRLGWPSRLRGGAHIAAVHPNGRDIAVGLNRPIIWRQLVMNRLPDGSWGGLRGSGWSWDAPAMTSLVDRLLPEELWQRVQPLLPAPPPRPRGGVPRRIPDRNCVAALVFMARTSTPWSLLPATELGCESATTCWRRLDEWARAGVFEQLQALLLDELGEAGRIDLERVSVDSFSLRAVKGGT